MARLAAILFAVCCALAAAQEVEKVQASTGFLAKESDATFLTYTDAQLKKMHLKNHYIPGVNGVVFATPAPGDNKAQAYVDTGKFAVILGFVFMGVVILICWMECKTWCKTLTIFGH